MTDPLAVLRTPVEPTDPDPRFAADLRARLEDALLAGPSPRRPAMTTAPETTAPATPAARTAPAAAAREHTLTPYLGVADGRRAISWYVEVFDGHPRGEPMLDEDGGVAHAEVAIGDSVLMLAEGLAPPSGPASSSVVVQVPDVDATVRRAVDAGAELIRPPADNPYGRNAVVVDPFGHRWLVADPPRETAPAEHEDAQPAAGSTAEGTARPAAGPAAETPEPGRHGDIGYATLVVPDAERAKDFYGAVLGWRFSPGSVPGGWQVEGPTPPIGLWGGQEEPAVQLCYRVDDIDEAVSQVLARGGEAGVPEEKPYGWLVECTDDQGARFQLWEAPR